MPTSQMQRAARAFRAELLRHERAAASEMVRYYGNIWQNLDRKITAVVEAYYADPTRSTSWLYRLDRLTSLRSQTEEQIRAFVNFTEQKIKAEQLYMAESAQQHAAELIRLGLGTPPPGWSTTFNRLPIGALTELIGYLQDGSPLRSLLDGLVGEAGQAVADGLVQGLALGLNPRQVARNIRKALGGNMVRALRIARTEVLRSYRESTRRNYQANSELVKGWIWQSSRNERTCAACWSLHGSTHSLDEPMSDHPNGRCSQLPWVKSWEELGFSGLKESAPIEDGATAFEKLTDGQQFNVLGPAKFTAYKSGQITLKDLVGRKSSRKWGVMHYEKSLRELGLSRSELLKQYEKNYSLDRTFTTLEDIQKLSVDSVLNIGNINKEILLNWSQVSENSLVVLTGKQRAHYLENHKEMEKFERLLIDSVLDPNEVHRNKFDSMMAIFYRNVDDTHYLRTAVLMQKVENDKNHSILSYRIAGSSEVEKGRIDNRVIWKK